MSRSTRMKKTIASVAVLPAFLTVLGGASAVVGAASTNAAPGIQATRTVALSATDDDWPWEVGTR